MNELKGFLESDETRSIEDVKTFISEKELQDQAAVLKGTQFEEGIKNKSYFELAEKIRFAKLQRESLRDTGAYNRHIAKSLHEMKNELMILFELGIEKEEIEAVLEKYLEFTGSVGTKQAWEDYDALKAYPIFSQFDASRNAGRYRED